MKSREGRAGDGEDGGQKGGKWGTSVLVSTIKKNKKRNLDYFESYMSRTS